MQLGARLRRLRQVAGVTREAAGWEIRGSESKISRMELGQVPVKARDITDLCALYGVHPEERAALLDLAQRASIPGWWHRYGDIVPPWFQSYLGLEEAASQIRACESHFVPGLLQTPEYARAVIRLGHSNTLTGDVDRRLDLRRDRQQVLRRADPPMFWVIIDEAVLRQRVGGPDVMRAQLECLIEAAQLPHVRIQVLPFHAGAQAAGCPFSILRFPEPELSDVVYVEQLTSAVYLDKPADLDHYAMVFDRACVEAEPPDSTVPFLRAVRTELD
ncbi:helix-turn-helix domain-containing protein [Wangella sp. NEAU-J3]|nr:helix-turn-helix transcriptional regulator [Jidongwangia harbinensis]MCA2213174.1 helix-turn-helix domain-containing protein [Jidongwangia harbinensis]